MATFDRPHAHVDEAREALRPLAHATPNVDDPTKIYSVLAELTDGLASLAQSLHQIGDFHEGQARQRLCVTGEARSGRAASYQVAWELHRAAEMVHQFAAGLDRAYEVEATISYDMRDRHTLAPASRPTHEPGMRL